MEFSEIKWVSPTTYEESIDNTEKWDRLMHVSDM